MSLLDSVAVCLPLIGLVQSAGSLGWFTQLVKRSVSLDFEMRCATSCMQLLRDIASIMQSLYNPYHLLLRSRLVIIVAEINFNLCNVCLLLLWWFYFRFGLYGLPMESSLFDIEPPALGKTMSVPLTYASIVAGDAGSNQTTSHPEIDLRDLYNYSGMCNLLNI